jgi:hypothetical protein
MSYNLDIVKSKTGNSASVEEVVNFTSNLGPMLNTALKGAFPELYPTGDEWWRDHVDGVRCDKVLVLFEGVLARMKGAPATYRRLEPSNKWGTYKDMVRIMEEQIIPALKRNPKRYVRIYA